MTLTACSDKKAYTEIYSIPEKIETSVKAPIQRVTFALTNNLDGKIEPQKEFYEKNQGVFLLNGGCSQTVKYVKALKEFHKDSLVFAHVGSILSGDDSNTLSSISCMTKLEHDVVAPSPKDILRKELFHDNRISPSFLVSNYIDLKTGKPLNDPPFVSSIFLEKNGVNVGVISIITPEILHSQTGKNFINGIFIEDVTTSILKEKNDLKAKGAHIIALMAQTLTHCHGSVLTMQKLKTEQLDCRFSDPLKNIIKKLPAGSIDIILSGANNMGNGYLAEIPVLQNTGEAQYISLAELYVNTATNQLLKERTRVLPPIKICSKYFEKTQDCFMKTTKKFDFGVTREDMIGETPKFISPRILGIPLEKY